jgi:PilZ domain-containing protein
MKEERFASGGRLQSVTGMADRRQGTRPSVEFGLMYSAQSSSEEILMGDGMVTDLSPMGLGIRGNASVAQGTELTIFLYLPDGRDPLFVMEARVAWSSGRRFGVEILKMNLREQNRLHHFLRSNLAHAN